MSTRALVPYRSNPIGGKPATHHSIGPTEARGQPPLSKSRFHHSSSPVRSLDGVAVAPVSIQPTNASYRVESGGHSDELRQFQQFQPKSTTFIRRLDPSEVFNDDASGFGAGNDFEDGGIIFDPRGLFPGGAGGQILLEQHPQPAGAKGKSGAAQVRVLKQEHANDDFQFTPEDFEQGQTTYFQLPSFLSQLNLGPTASNSKPGVPSGGRPRINRSIPQPNLTQASASNALVPFRRSEAARATNGCSDPNCTNCSVDPGGPIMQYESVNVEPNMEQENRTTYGYAEFQAARQHFENIGKSNARNQQMVRYSKRPQTNDGMFRQVCGCNQAPKPAAMAVGGGEGGFADVQLIQQYVVAEEDGPGGVKKTFSFPAGEEPGDMTLLRAAVAANQPRDAFVPDNVEEQEEEEDHGHMHPQSVMRMNFQGGVQQMPMAGQPNRSAGNQFMQAQNVKSANSNNQANSFQNMFGQVTRPLSLGGGSSRSTHAGNNNSNNGFPQAFTNMTQMTQQMNPNNQMMNVSNGGGNYIPLMQNQMVPSPFVGAGHGVGQGARGVGNGGFGMINNSLNNFANIKPTTTMLTASFADAGMRTGQQKLQMMHNHAPAYQGMGNGFQMYPSATVNSFQMPSRELTFGSQSGLL